MRTEQNWVGGSGFSPCTADFVPPPPEHVPDLLEDLCAYLSGDNRPAVMQAALVHAQFETIHPFLDGNGRVGRALIHADRIGPAGRSETEHLRHVVRHTRTTTG